MLVCAAVSLVGPGLRDGVNQEAASLRKERPVRGVPAGKSWKVQRFFEEPGSFWGPDPAPIFFQVFFQVSRRFSQVFDRPDSLVPDIIRFTAMAWLLRERPASNLCYPSRPAAGCGLGTVDWRSSRGCLVRLKRVLVRWLGSTFFEGPGRPLEVPRTGGS